MISLLNPFLNQFDPPGSFHESIANPYEEKKSDRTKIYGKSLAVDVTPAEAAAAAVATALLPPPMSQVEVAAESVASIRKRNAATVVVSMPLIETVHNFATQPIISPAVAIAPAIATTSPSPVIFQTTTTDEQANPSASKQKPVLNPPNHTAITLEPPRDRDTILKELSKKKDAPLTV